MQAYKTLIRANGCDATNTHNTLTSAHNTIFEAGQDDVPSLTTLRRHLKQHGHYTKRYPSGGIRFMIEAFR